MTTQSFGEEADIGEREATGNAATKPLSRKTIWGYAIGSLGTGGYNTLPGLVLIFYMTDTLAIAAIWAGLIVTIAKIWDVIIDPFIGAMSDLIMKRHGSRRSLMLIGAVALPILFTLTFTVAPGIHPTLATIWVLIAYSLAAIGFSLYQVPYIALPAELTHNYQERTRLLTWRVVVLTFAILVFGGGGPEIRDVVTGLTGNAHTGYFVMAALLAAVILTAMLISLKAVPKRPKHFEPEMTEHSFFKQTLIDGFRSYTDSIGLLKKAKPFRALWIAYSIQALAIGLLLGVVQYVATWILGTGVTLLFVSLIAPALILTPMWKYFADRHGKEPVFVWATILFALSCAATGLLLIWPGQWIYIPVFFAGTAFAGVQTLGLAMLPDAITADSVVRSGQDQAGLFSGIWTAGETSGLAFGASILAIVLTITGYIESSSAESITQPQAALDGIVYGLSIIPAIILLASLIFFRKYRLDEKSVNTLGA